ncbi:MAG: ferredoxin family protein [Victivallales bacterium]|nr:ferredoxin family protein [Victivallales bacterium]
MSTNKKNVVIIEPDECKGCERCVLACPKSVLTMSTALNKYGFPYAFYAGDGCIGCGGCFYSCPEPGAITIIEEYED